MNGRNLDPRAPYKHPLLEGVSREAMIIFRVLAGAGLCYFVYSAATDTGLVRLLSECEATFNNGLHHPKFVLGTALLCVLTPSIPVARLFDRVTGRGNHSPFKK